jgi:exodeoxyribonuclease V gamma subunit
MNDGDFPRRDPAAGLNQLTAQLGTDQRRHGDRSTREDDRFLFLQLFASAQDAFYLSYLGADPRDGSVREPSVLVTELITAAADYHLDAKQAAEAMTVRHALQPFAPAAFGADGDPRRFSYRGQWQPAAGRIGGHRERLKPWFDHPLLPMDAVESALSLDDLRRFLTAPATQFLRQRLDLRLADEAETSQDVEPLLMAGGGLEKMQLQHEVFNALLTGNDGDLYARLRARALLPSGPLGRRELDALVEATGPYAKALTTWRGTAAPTSQRVEVELDGVRLHGLLGDVYPQGQAQLRFGPLNGPAAIRQGLNWLLASAADLQFPQARFHEEGEGGIGPFARAPLAPEAARAVLRHLLQLRQAGLQAPLPFGPYSGWEYFNAPDHTRAVKLAAARWRGSERSWGEGNAESYRLALRGRDPFADQALLVQFANTSFDVYRAVVDGVVHAGFDDDRGFATEADDAEGDA